VVDRAVNGVSGAARRTGKGEAETDLVMLIDSDDLLEPTALEKLYWFMQSIPTIPSPRVTRSDSELSRMGGSTGFHRGDASLSRISPISPRWFVDPCMRRSRGTTRAGKKMLGRFLPPTEGPRRAS